MMAMRSDAVMLVFRNFRAPVCARIWSSTGMPWKSKYITISRRSRYLISPGLDEAIEVCTTDATGGATGVAMEGAATAKTAAVSAAVGAACAWSEGAAGASKAGRTASSSRWYSNTLMTCGFPSSATVKSVAFKPSMGLPSLSFTETLTITSWVVDSNL